MYKFVIAYHFDDTIASFLGVKDTVQSIDDPGIRVFDTREDAVMLDEHFSKILRVHISNLDVSVR